MYRVVVRMSCTYSSGAEPVRMDPSWSVTMYCIACTTGTSSPVFQSRSIERSVMATSSLCRPLIASRE